MNPLNLDPNKEHRYDSTSICMFEIYDKSICKPLEIVCKSCLKKQCFPSEWKKTNAVPIHNKDDKQMLRNFHAISLLPISGKIFIV